MTANLITGKSFRGAIKYNLDKVDKNVAEVLDPYNSLIDIKSIIYIIFYINKF